MIVVAIACRHFGADPAIAGPAIGVASIAIMIALSWTTEEGRVAFLGHDL